MIKSAFVVVQVIILFLASFAYAGCVGVLGANSWEILDPQSVLVYDFNRPIVIFKTPWCNIFNLSDICLKESLICTGDKIFVDNQACEIRELIPIDLNVNFVPQRIATLTLYVKGYSEFSQDEFRNKFSVKALSSDISKDEYEIELKTPDNTIERLNEILRTPNFYDAIVKKGKNPKLNTHGQNLASETKKYRNKSYSALSEDEQMDISHLNRIMLEALYPQTCPKGYMKSCPK